HLCEQGEAGRGLVWLARSLEMAAAYGAEDLQRASRACLAGWYREIHPLRVVFQHEGGARRLGGAISPHGKRGLTASWDDLKPGPAEMRLWETATGKPLSPPILLQHKDKITTISYSPDRKTVLTASNDKTAKLWETATGKLLHSLDHQGSVWAAP